MRALELADRTPALASAVVGAGFERGLLLLSCGTYGNVVRLLPPLSITDDELQRGLELLEEAFVDAGARAAG
jgi:4-aminobutyrate aminotransferase-like enzyme